MKSSLHLILDILQHIPNMVSCTTTVGDALDDISNGSLRPPTWTSQGDLFAYSNRPVLRYGLMGFINGLSRKTVAQANPGNAATTIYTVPAATTTVVKTILVTNTSSSSRTYRIFLITQDQVIQLQMPYSMMYQFRPTQPTL